MSSSIFVDNPRSYLEKMLAILDLEATVLEEELDENTICYRIDCKPDDARILIGREGQTLEALQFIVRQMCRNTGSEQKPFLIDILDYRSRRQRSLEGQAKRAAVAVLNGDAEHMDLPPMNAYERRTVHQYLQDNFPDLVTQSQGEGPERHIVVSFKGADAQTEEPHEQTESHIAVEGTAANTES
jgi:spoIIIJ-associated protein